MNQSQLFEQIQKTLNEYKNSNSDKPKRIVLAKIVDTLQGLLKETHNEAALQSAKKDL